MSLEDQSKNYYRRLEKNREKGKNRVHSGKWVWRTQISKLWMDLKFIQASGVNFIRTENELTFQSRNYSFRKKSKEENLKEYREVYGQRYSSTTLTDNNKDIGSHLSENQ